MNGGHLRGQESLDVVLGLDAGNDTDPMIQGLLVERIAAIGCRGEAPDLAVHETDIVDRNRRCQEGADHRLAFVLDD